MKWPHSVGSRNVTVVKRRCECPRVLVDSVAFGNHSLCCCYLQCQAGCSQFTCSTYDVNLSTVGVCLLIMPQRICGTNYISEYEYHTHSGPSCLKHTVYCILLCTLYFVRVTIKGHYQQIPFLYDTPCYNVSYAASLVANIALPVPHSRPVSKQR